MHHLPRSLHRAVPGQVEPYRVAVVIGNFGVHGDGAQEVALSFGVAAHVEMALALSDEHRRVARIEFQSPLGIGQRLFPKAPAPLDPSDQRGRIRVARLAPVDGDIMFERRLIVAPAVIVVVAHRHVRVGEVGGELQGFLDSGPRPRQLARAAELVVQPDTRAGEGGPRLREARVELHSALVARDRRARVFLDEAPVVEIVATQV